MSKKKRTPKSDGKPVGTVHFYESDDGKNWSEFDPGEPEVKDLDIARLENPDLDYLGAVPIDHRTCLGILPSGAREMLGLHRLPAIKQRFGDSCTIPEVRDYVEQMGRSAKDVTWTDVFVIMEREAASLRDKNPPKDKLPKRPRGKLDEQVKDLMRTEKSPTEIAKILNTTYRNIYRPTSPKAVEGTRTYIAYKEELKKNTR